MTKNRLHCLFAVLFVTAVLAGCAPSKILPERFAEVNEAYPDAASTVSPSDRPAAVERATFSAPLAVVYRVALTTAAQVGLRIVSNDKEQGVILAEEIIDNLPAPVGNNRSEAKERRYFYAIVAKERGPKRTELRVMTKVQGWCVFVNPTGFANFLTAGVGTPFALKEKQDCEAYAQLHWADKLANAKPLLSRYMGEVHKKLIAAGYE